jgi:hypothetical protein
LLAAPARYVRRPLRGLQARGEALMNWPEALCVCVFTLGAFFVIARNM